MDAQLNFMSQVEIMPGTVIAGDDVKAVGSRHCPRCDDLRPAFHARGLRSPPLQRAEFCVNCRAFVTKPAKLYGAASNSLTVEVIYGDGTTEPRPHDYGREFPAKVWHAGCRASGDVEMRLYDVEQISHDVAQAIYECTLCRHERMYRYRGALPLDVWTKIKRPHCRPVHLSGTWLTRDDEVIAEFTRRKLNEAFVPELASVLFDVLADERWRRTPHDLRRLSARRARFQLGTFRALGNNYIRFIPHDGVPRGAVIRLLTLARTGKGERKW